MSDTRPARPVPPAEDGARAPGWYVDDRCTDCDVARQLAPGLIGRAGRTSRVLRQPRDAAEEQALHRAAFACHTRSVRPPSGPLDPAADPYPLALDETVLLCGHNSSRTAGANSYLLRRPGGGLMMIDTPRWSASLATRYERLGPVTDVLLTHQDHAAHGRTYADRFGARLWIHEGDIEAAPDADRVLRGTEPVEVGEGVVAHPLPGHTKGSVLYVADERYCFSGDSFYWSRTTGDLEIAESVTWYSVTELAASLARTADRLRFGRVLPGHGGGKELPPDRMADRLRLLTERAQRMRPRPVDFTAVRW
ncbi:MBL fold metallo-hydrolase [Streptomyces clavuligerus]|uniref:Beta-lactamase domain-containing protein n=4 Tax=Streptomyces clavuligerus TaxID=1901 RepID=B5H0T1_STRCL|nr:MBL fold metallo-hydrolase [Streptomyces clavuligerus]ANW21630.1 MBL fold metallo-hydrolase [Streptomyces clavuligerus]AXU16256.1 MBL fold metallo-hydrolase [Streptomyces clavuligerus]EDY52177.1 beta-lactamase domain-containing protein [Streptomyces clavuligerus]EFG05195.1 beta-lactamase domain-containing protein [Streptomyces clavuligerus]MBY6306414.1 MBL fold metallo-hydrolase [Streptomyces clavuligerus]